MQALQSRSHHEASAGSRRTPAATFFAGCPSGRCGEPKGDIIVVCDRENCPASATHLIFAPAGEIVLCSHHFNEVIADVLILGYEVHARVLEGV